jgi:hypothetical protein
VRSHGDELREQIREGQEMSLGFLEGKGSKQQFFRIMGGPSE